MVLLDQRVALAHKATPAHQGNPGGQGNPGVQGSAGENAWSPELAVVNNGARRVLRIDDWFGGQGTKPTTGQYIGANGLVTNISNGIDIRGAAGVDAIGAGVIGWGETPTNQGEDDSIWVYTQPDYRNAVQGTRISLAGYNNIALRGLSIDGNTMYVLDDDNDEIALFSLSGAFQSVISIASGGYEAISISSGLAYVLDNNVPEVVVYTPLRR